MEEVLTAAFVRDETEALIVHETLDRTIDC